MYGPELKGTRALRQYGICETGGAGVARATVLLCIKRSERAVLAQLYEECDGPHWASQDYWNSDEHFMLWHGISAGRWYGTESQDSVIKIVLRQNTLRGLLPSCIGALHSLQQLDLSNNSLSGPLPDELCDCCALARADLHGNGFTALPSPRAVAKLVALAMLDLRENRLADEALTEELAIALRSLPNLEDLWISKNFVSVEHTSAFASLLPGIEVGC